METIPISHLRGFGCQKCGFDSTAQKNGMTKEDFIKKAENTHGVGTYDYSKVEFINSKTKVIITCLKHGDFGQQPTAHMISCGCPKCYSSSGERRIRLYLEKHNLDFIEQMKFEDCKFELPLLFDFYLPDYNLLIEFDGRQHFEPVDYFGGKEELLKTQKRDMIKNEFAVRQKIKLLRISYKDKKDIEKILKINNLP